MKYIALLPLLFALCGSAQAQVKSDVFDEPERKVVAPLISQDMSSASTQLRITCFYYKGFMVKEVDIGEKGAEKLSITRMVSEHFMPCAKDNPGEILIKDWAGYFEGVRGGYVFFAPDDGYNGGIDYAVFNSENGQKLFNVNSEGRNESIHSVTLIEDGIVVRYRRAYNTSCSLYENAPGCWDKIKKELSISEDSTLPDCRKAYEFWQKRSPKNAAEIAKYSSMVGYEAETTYVSGKTITTAKPGIIRCWLPE